MYPHHRAALDRVADKLSADADVLGVLLAGSIAHGFAKPGSDVDIMVVLPDALYAERAANGMLTGLDLDCCDYDGGYIDIKYVSVALLERVAKDGSEPARFAYDSAQIVFARIDGLEAILADIVRYPAKKKQKNLERFFAQLQAWNWYCGEALKHENAYLLGHTINNLILFGGRLLLAHNEVLYPYHKWFLRVLSGVREQPDGLMTLIDDVLAKRDADAILRFYTAISEFRDWPAGNWSHQFMMDSELTWMTGHTPVADL